MPNWLAAALATVAAVLSVVALAVALNRAPADHGHPTPTLPPAHTRPPSELPTVPPTTEPPVPPTDPGDG